MKFKLLVLICALGVCGLRGAAPQAAAPPQPFIIGISPYLDKSVKDDVYRSIIRLLVEDLPLGSTLTVYDAFELKTITQVNLPAISAFNSAKTRANQFAPAVRDLKMFLARDHIKPIHSHLTFDGAIRLPQFLDFLDENLPRTAARPAVLLIGSPLYQDAKEPAFSMINGYFPSDGHLQASREKSVFGFTQGSGELPSLTLHWMYFGDPWVSDLHKEKVTRFWTLYLHRREAELAAFTSDFPTVLRSFCQAAAGTKASTARWNIDAAQTKIEMLRVGRTVDTADWLTRDNVATAQTPPRTMVGPMKIGIRWPAAIDLDLYATAHPGAETLFFEHTRAPEGYYYKDHRSSPGKEYEFIEFETPVDVRQVEAAINFYKGSCSGGPHGEVRIEFEGRIYGGPFSLPAEHGNLGRSGRSQQEFWTKIPLLELLKLAPTAAGTVRDTDSSATH